MASVDASYRTEVDDVVRLFDRLWIVFDEDQRVAKVFEAVEGAIEPFRVFWMEADGRFIEDIEHRAGRYPVGGQGGSVAFLRRRG